MTSKREQVGAAIEALVRAALPTAAVTRNQTKADEIPAAGAVDISDGDPGEPEVDLSPLTYNYSHPFGLLFGALPTASLTAGQALDAMQVAVGDAVEADRTLGGLVDWLETVAPDRGDLDMAGAESGAASEAAIIAHYSTTSPL